MQAYIQQNWTQVLDADKQISSIWCNINFCIQSVSSSCNYYTKAKINAAIYAGKSNASIWCRQIVTSIRCSINPCIQSVSSSWNFLIKKNKMHAYMQPNLIQLLGAVTLLASIKCSIIPCIQSASSACNYCIKEIMDAGIYMAPNWHIVASIGCGIIPYIQRFQFLQLIL